MHGDEYPGGGRLEAVGGTTAVSRLWKGRSGRIIGGWTGVGGSQEAG